MSWSTPITWTAGQTVTAAQLNAQVRDNFNQTYPGVVTTAGDIAYATAANTLTRLGIGSSNQVLGLSGSALVWVNQTGGSAAGGGQAKIQLNFSESTDLFNGSAMTTGAWTTFKANQNFTVDDANSIFVFVVHLGALYNSTPSIGGQCAIRVNVNSGGTPILLKLGAFRAPAVQVGEYGTFLGGVAYASGLPAGTNTVAVQYWATQAGVLFCRASTNPNYEFLDVQVIELKPVVSVLYNYLCNGGFETWQRGTGAFTATTAYSADRWQIILAGTDALSVSQVSAAANKKTNSQFSAGCTFTLGTGAGATTLKQRLTISDGFHFLLGQAISFRIACKTGTAAANSVRSYIKTDGTGGTTNNSGYHGNNTSFEDMDVTNVVVPTDATFIEVGVFFAAGAGVIFYLDNAILVQQSFAVAFQPLAPAEELQRCQRYYEIHGATVTTFPAFNFSANGAHTISYPISFLAPKAGTPTLTKNGATWTVVNCAQPTVDAPNTQGYRLNAAATGAGAGSVVPSGNTDFVSMEINP